MNLVKLITLGANAGVLIGLYLEYPEPFTPAMPALMPAIPALIIALNTAAILLLTKRKVGNK